MPDANKISERDFQQQLIDLAHIYGYRVAHFRPARTEKGWRTPVSADGKGFPDLIMVNPHQKRLIAIECKANGKKPTPEQEEWLEVFDYVPGCESYILRPSDFDEVQEILKPKGGRE